jgi:hypothetical protein
MKLQRRTLLLVCLICGAMLFPIPLPNGIDFMATPAWAHDVTPHPHAEDSKVGNTKHIDPEHGSLGNVGAKLANPVSDLWSMSMNFEFLKFYDGDINTGDAKVGSDLILQPVMPIPLFGEGDGTWRLVTRPIIPIVLSQPVPRSFNKFYNKAGIGDIQLPALINLPAKYAGNWIAGAGPVALFPTATTDELGSDQFALGPAVVFGYKTKKWTAVLFPNYFWRVGSHDQDRDTEDISQGSLLYALTFNLPNAWQAGTNPTITYNDKASSGNKWNVPVGVFVGKTTMICDMPVNIKFGIEYSVISEDDYGKILAFRLQVTPVIKSLIQNPIFGK